MNHVVSHMYMAGIIVGMLGNFLFIRWRNYYSVSMRGNVVFGKELKDVTSLGIDSLI